MIIAKEDIKQLTAEVPAGHHHLRSTVILRDGSELPFQEVTIERKEWNAEWQLIEDGKA
jgi:hypothetical protein